MLVKLKPAPLAGLNGLPNIMSCCELKRILKTSRTPLRANVDKYVLSIYNVITMLTTLIAIGNSRGVRIPKPLLDESGLNSQVELQVKKGEIRIISAPTKAKIADTLLLSEKVLSTDWDRPEEDKAWKNLR